MRRQRLNPAGSSTSRTGLLLLQMVWYAVRVSQQWDNKPTARTPICASCCLSVTQQLAWPTHQLIHQAWPGHAPPREGHITAAATICNPSQPSARPDVTDPAASAQPTLVAPHQAQNRAACTHHSSASQQHQLRTKSKHSPAGLTAAAAAAQRCRQPAAQCSGMGFTAPTAIRLCPMSFSV